ncbi:flavin monoamine oxidase family protein [Polyangium mundeleinium]|uniref:NAD(P)/FAD-dependent oxidoreductase n=1 Tax=Polyangium mundeleinium TaxID=2995306 RepID=A0ABT5ELK7_9BACT|nr:NAD(P)/FAD-dependent oxidoreductase [Polyangium mundeleinium]MDC0741807.1 NAD(P)/FAD-dependent oxidoreductase [Polyangium mundeleinium]
MSRLLQISRAARQTGIPASEILAMQRERAALPRRRFLEMSAAALTLPIAASACGGEDPPKPPPAGEPTIAIVGGGIAGLHCAYRLKKLGVTATVYEASKRIGGRMYSDRATFPDGQHCELGGELIDTGHETMHDLAAELGIDLLDYKEDDPGLEHLVAHIGGTKLTEAEILSGFEPIAAKIDEALATLTDQEDLFVYYDKPNGGEALDALSLSAWLDQIGASGPVRTLLEVAYNIEYGLEPDVTNVLNMMFLISTDTSSFEVFGDSDELFHAKDGNDAFPTRLAEDLNPEQIELEAALVSLREEADGRYVLTFSRGSGTFEVTADHVVLALPFTKLREVTLDVELPEVKKRAIDELGYGTNAKLMVGFSSRPWRDAGSNGETFSDLPYQSSWETSRLQPGASGILTNFVGGDRGVQIGMGTPEERAAEFLNEIDQVFPGTKAAHNDKVARFHWPTQPFTLGSYSAYKVGQYTTITGAESLRVRNIHFAGEHTSLDAQGYMEGGALSGAIVADEIAGDLGISTQKLLRGQEERPRSLWLPGDRILSRARAARTHRRWKTARRRAR